MRYVFTRDPLVTPLFGYAVTYRAASKWGELEES